MAPIKTDTNQLNKEFKRIESNILAGMNANKLNSQVYAEFREYVYNSMLSEDQRNQLIDQDKPIAEANIILPYLNRLEGQFAEQEPGVEVSAYGDQPLPQEFLTQLEDHIRCIQYNANSTAKTDLNVYSDILSGGQGAVEVWYDYEHPRSFAQHAGYRRIENPTLCFWDPLAQQLHGGDGEYCGRRHLMYKTEFERLHPTIDLSEIKFDTVQRDWGGPGSSWGYINKEGKKIIIFVEYYEKKYEKEKWLELDTGQTMSPKEYQAMLQSWQSISTPPPIVIQEKDIDEVSIVRYLVIGNQVIPAPNGKPYEDTPYSELPYIRYCGKLIELGNPTTGKIEKRTFPYHYTVKGVQLLLNFSLINYINEISRLSQYTWRMPLEGIPKGKQDAYQNPQKPSMIFYHQYHPLDPSVPLNPPDIVQRQPIPQAISEGIGQSVMLMQNLLGNFDLTSEGQRGPVSGKAYIQSLSKNNAMAMPAIVGYMACLSQTLLCVTKLLTKLYSPQDSRGVGMMDLNRQLSNRPLNSWWQEFYPHGIKVKVSAGISTQLQREKTLEQIQILSQNSKEIAAYFADINGGLPFVLKLVDIQGAGNLTQHLQEWQAKQSPRPDPEEQQQEFKRMELQAKMKNQEFDNMINAQRLELDRLKMALEEAKIHLKALEDDRKYKMTKGKQAVEIMRQAREDHEKDQDAIKTWERNIQEEGTQEP